MTDGRTTAAATTGPARQPSPTSSTPATTERGNPHWISYSIVGSATLRLVFTAPLAIPPPRLANYGFAPVPFTGALGFSTAATASLVSPSSLSILAARP